MIHGFCCATHMHDNRRDLVVWGGTAVTQAHGYRPKRSRRVRLLSHLSEWSLQPQWHLCSSAPGIIYAELFSELSRSCPLHLKTNDISLYLHATRTKQSLPALKIVTFELFQIKIVPSALNISQELEATMRDLLFNFLLVKNKSIKLPL